MLITGILANFTQGVRRYYPFVEVGRWSGRLRRSWRRCPAATAELSHQ